MTYSERNRHSSKRKGCMAKHQHAHKKETMKLSEQLVKELAQDIEKSNRTRKDFDLQRLVDEKPHTCGEPGNDKRRAAQKKFDQLVRKTPESYLKFLDKFGVDAGEALKREIRLEQTKASASECDEDESEDEDDDSEFSEQVTKTSTKKSTKSKKTKSTKASLPPKPPAVVVASPTPPKTPPTEISIKSELFSPIMSTASSLHTSDTNAAATVLDQVRIMESFRMDGSADYPHVIMANAVRPECNFGFDICQVNGVEYRNFDRKVIVMRKATAVPQEKEWEAYVPLVRFRTLADRSVLVRGPSQDFWHKDGKLHHETSEMCEATQKAHSKHETEIKSDPSRQCAHCLIVFPPGTDLENHILSDNAVLVKRGSNEMSTMIDLHDGVDEDEEEEEEVADNSFKDAKDGDGEDEAAEKKNERFAELLGLDVYWRIAKKGGELIRSPSPQKKKNQRFKNRGKSMKKLFKK